MCTSRITRKFTTEHDILAYKVVSKRPVSGFESWVTPWDRVEEEGATNCGTIVPYDIDRQSKSEWPGMYCHVHLNAAKSFLVAAIRYRDPVIIAVVIPAGTEVIEGYDTGSMVLLTPILTPIRQL